MLNASWLIHRNRTQQKLTTTSSYRMHQFETISTHQVETIEDSCRQRFSSPAPVEHLPTGLCDGQCMGTPSSSVRTNLHTRM